MPGWFINFDLLTKFLEICSYDIIRNFNKDLSTRVFAVVSFIPLGGKKKRKRLYVHNRSRLKVFKVYVSTIQKKLQLQKYVSVKNVERHIHNTIH